MIFTQEVRAHWKTVSKTCFRYIFSYIIIYLILIFISSFIEDPLRWFANNILHWGGDFEIKQTGSGDTTHAYVTLAFNTVLAVIVGTIWTIVDRKRPSYNQLFYWFQVVLRLTLFNFMLVYGFAKVVKGQFPDASLTRLLQPLGDFSPMGLAWTYMGYSVAFNLFAGLAEVLGGVLVLFRKTATVGALIIMGVMIHVAMMNFTYDIPVKIFSVHLVLMALLLFLTDVKRTLNVFFRNKATKAVDYYTVTDDKTYHQVTFWIKIVVMVVLSGLLFFGTTARLEGRNDQKMEKPFYGIWEAKQFIKNGDTIPTLVTDDHRWRYLILEKKTSAKIKLMTDSITNYNLEIEKETQTFKLYKEQTDSLPPNLKYTFINEALLELKGTLDTDSLEILLFRIDEQEFELKKRGFNWVNEYPRNL